MKPKQIVAVTRYNFRRWHKNPRIVITFCLAFAYAAKRRLERI